MHFFLQRRRLLVVASSVLVLVFVGTWLTTRGWKGPPGVTGEVSHSTQVRQREPDSDLDADFVSHEQLISQIDMPANYGQPPLSNSLKFYLGHADAHFGRYVLRNEGFPETASTQARAFRNLAKINQLLGRLELSETAYRRTRQLLQQQDSLTPAAEATLYQADMGLSCLLVAMGKNAEANALAGDAVEQLERTFLQEDQDVLQSGTLATAHRNLGITRAILGLDGTEEVRSSIELAQRTVAAAPDTLAPDEFLADSYQILVYLLWRQDRLAEAKRACQEGIHVLDSILVRHDAMRERLSLELRLHKYLIARAMAQANLGFLQDAVESGRTDPENWQWTPLGPFPEQRLQADELASGLLHGEFEPQEAVLLPWRDVAWCDRTVTRVVQEIHQDVRVILLLTDDLAAESARDAMRKANVALDNVQFIQHIIESPWVRDYGPLVVETAPGTFKWIDAPMWNNRPHGDHLPVSLADRFGAPLLRAPIWAEGGAVLSNGAGLCIVSRHLLESNLRIGYDELHVTNTVKRLFGAEQVLYLEPLHDEPTRHVDWFATFTATDTIVIGEYDSSMDPKNAELLDRHAQELAKVDTPTGKLKVVRIPMPPRRAPFGGTYTNVLFANGVLLVPTWPEAPEETEQEALDVFRELLPDWKVVGIDCRDLAHMKGALHCLSMNLYRIPKLP
jgi:agmatine/peptidylarginine deiminase